MFYFCGRIIETTQMKSVKILLGTLLCLISADAMAGGLVTNTNQNPVFYRQPAQNAVVGVQGVYYNPAGLTLLDKGWHFYVGDQLAIQTREITSTYAPFALGAKNNGSATKLFKGSTVAPFIPNVDVAYNHGRWAASFHFGFISGGGACQFNDGLGSFEAPMALLPSAVNAIWKGIGMPGTLFSGYDVDINFNGKSMAPSGQFNFSYKVLDSKLHKLSFAAGIRVNYLTNTYTGGIYNYQLGMGSQMMPASTAVTTVLTALGVPQAMAQQYGQVLGADKEVECTQTDWAWTPILSAHYRVSIVDIALRYEFNTKVRLKNSTTLNSANIASFADGAETPADIPALLAGGVNVNVLPVLRLAAGFNLYFDKNANYNGREQLLDGNTFEGYFGAEWDICKLFTLSAGTQITRFHLGENNAYCTDMSFSLPNWCLGGGGRFNINEHFGIDFSVFNCFYEHATKKYADYGNAGATFASQLSGTIPDSMLSQLKVPGEDDFYRTSLSFGLGLVMKF